MKFNICFSFFCLFLFQSYKKDDDQKQNLAAQNLMVLSVSDNTFWGEVMTISGTGFSLIKEENNIELMDVFPAPFYNVKYTMMDGDLRIESVSETETKLRIPYRAINGNTPGHLL